MPVQLHPVYKQLKEQGMAWHDIHSCQLHGTRQASDKGHCSWVAYKLDTFPC